MEGPLWRFSALVHCMGALGLVVFLVVFTVFSTVNGVFVMDAC